MIFLFALLSSAQTYYFYGSQPMDQCHRGRVWDEVDRRMLEPLAGHVYSRISVECPEGVLEVHHVFEAWDEDGEEIVSDYLRSWEGGRLFGMEVDYVSSGLEVDLSLRLSEKEILRQAVPVEGLLHAFGIRYKSSKLLYGKDWGHFLRHLLDHVDPAHRGRVRQELVGASPSALLSLVWVDRLRGREWPWRVGLHRVLGEFERHKVK